MNFFSLASLGLVGLQHFKHSFIVAGIYSSGLPLSITLAICKNKALHKRTWQERYVIIPKGAYDVNEYGDIKRC